MTNVDFAPLINAVFVVLATIVTAAAGVLLPRLFRWLGLKGDNEAAKLAEPILQNALAFGQAATGLLPHTLNAKNAIVAQAANYAIQALANTLKNVDRGHVENMLLARLEANVSAQLPDVTATAAAPMPTTVSKPPEVVPVAIPVAPQPGA